MGTTVKTGRGQAKPPLAPPWASLPAGETNAMAMDAEVYGQQLLFVFFKLPVLPLVLDQQANHTSLKSLLTTSHWLL